MFYPVRAVDGGFVVGRSPQVERNNGIMVLLMGCGAFALRYFVHTPLRMNTLMFFAVSCWALGIAGIVFAERVSRWTCVVFDKQQRVVRSNGRTVIFNAVDCLRVVPYVPTTYQLKLFLRDGSTVVVFRDAQGDERLLRLARFISDETGIPIG